MGVGVKSGTGNDINLLDISIKQSFTCAPWCRLSLPNFPERNFIAKNNKLIKGTMYHINFEKSSEHWNIFVNKKNSKMVCLEHSSILILTFFFRGGAFSVLFLVFSIQNKIEKCIATCSFWLNVLSCATSRFSCNYIIVNTQVNFLDIKNGQKWKFKNFELKSCMSIHL